LISTLHSWLLPILVHGVVSSHRPSCPGIGIIEVNLLNKGILFKFLDRVAWGQRLLQERDGVVVYGFGELDVELNIQVARLMMPLRWHALPMNHLQVTYKTVSNDISIGGII
jgi:hypothetical protein